MKRLLGTLAAAATAVGLLIGLAAPAAAATNSASDPRYDALTLVDVTSVTVRNTASNLVVDVVAPDFRPETPTMPYQTLISWSMLLVTLEFGSGPQHHPDARRWQIVLVEADASGPRRLRLSQTGEDESIPRPCPGASYRLADGMLRVVVPQSCFGRYAGTVRVTTQLRSRADLLGSDGHAYVYRTPDIDYTDRTGWITRG